MNRSASAKSRRGGISAWKRSWRGERIGLIGALRELILAALSGILPWWFGANDPPAIYLISLLILALGLLTLIDACIQSRQSSISFVRILLAPPVFMLGMICLFGLIQWVEIDSGLLQTLSPARFELWKSLGGESMIQVSPEGPTFQLPARLAWLDAEVYESLIWLVSLWVLVICVIRLPGRWGPLKRHSMVMVISALLMGIESMLQAMTFSGKILWIRQAAVIISSAGPFFVHSHLASYLNIGLGFALAHICFMSWQSGNQANEEHLFAEQRQGIGRGFFWIYTAGFTLVSVLASRSRGGMLAMVLAMAALVAFWAISARKLRKISAGSMEWKWLVGLLVVAVFSMTLFTDVFAIFSRASGIIGQEGGHAAGVRRRVWAIAWETWKEAPVWGTGWGSYLWASQRNFRSNVGYSTHAESDYVQALPEGGLIGFILVLGALASLSWVVVRLAWRIQQPRQMALVGGGLFGLTAVAWGSLTENNLRTAGVAIPALITAAHLVRLSIGWEWFESKNWEDQAEGMRVGIFARISGVLTGLVLVAMAWAGQVQTGKVNQAWPILQEAELRPAGTDLRGWIAPAVKTDQLEKQRVALELVSRFLPDWGDYRIQQAITEVEIYERQTRETLISEGVSAEDAEKLSRMIQLSVVIKSLPEAERAKAKAEILSDPVVGSEVRKTIDFLAAAWQSQPVSAVVHSEMALLSWAFEQGPTSEDSLKRALAMVGQRGDLLVRIGQESIALGYEDLAIQAFAAVISIPESRMEVISAQILPWLSAEQIDQLASNPSGIVAVRAGESLVPETDSTRRKNFGQKALAQLPSSKTASDALTIELIARAQWLTGEREEAIDQLKLATAYQRDGFEMRERLIDWLIAAGRPSEALEQAQAVQYLWPADARTKPLLDKAATADARGAKPEKNEIKSDSGN